VVSGPPADLEAEAGPRPPAETAARRRFWLGWRGWSVVAAAVVILGAVVGYGIVVLRAAPLRMTGPSGWWYAQDSSRAVLAGAGGQKRTTVPIRSGRQQGFAITLYNDSGLTQTVLGAASGAGSPGSDEVLIGLSTAAGRDQAQALRYTLPGPIPPHQSRVLRVMWTSTTCLPRDRAQGINELPLKVRVGLIPRIEVVRLDPGWYISGPSQSPCS
jgi:hypothetical protein